MASRHKGRGCGGERGRRREEGGLTAASRRARAARRGLTELLLLGLLLLLLMMILLQLLLLSEILSLRAGCGAGKGAVPGHRRLLLRQDVLPLLLMLLLVLRVPRLALVRLLLLLLLVLRILMLVLRLLLLMLLLLTAVRRVRGELRGGLLLLRALARVGPTLAAREGTAAHAAHDPLAGQAAAGKEDAAVAWRRAVRGARKHLLCRRVGALEAAVGVEGQAVAGAAGTSRRSGRLAMHRCELLLVVVLRGRSARALLRKGEAAVAGLLLGQQARRARGPAARW